MRVLHFITSLGRGGIENWLMSVLRALDAETCRVDFLCKGDRMGEMAPEALELGAAIYHVPMGLRPFRFVKKSREIIRAGGYDIVHNHLEAYSALPVLAAKKLGVPVVSSFHNIEFEPQTSLARHPAARPLRRVFAGAGIKYALRNSDAVTGCSQAVIDRLSLICRDLQAKSRVIYYGIDTVPKSARARAEARKRMGVPDDVPLLMHIGRFVEQKNHEALLRVFGKVRDAVPHAMLVLIGDGPLRANIESLAEKLGIIDAILFLGTRSDAKALLDGCDIFLFPSLYEGFGLVALEANAAGIPVVGSKVSGIEEAVEDGATGMLFPPGDIEGMSGACIRLIHDQDMRTSYGERGLERAKRLFPTQSSLSALLETYHRVLEGATGA